LKPLALVHTSPRQELYQASKSGTPTMTPQSENEEGVDILTVGNQPRIGGSGTGIVATIQPGTPAAETTGSAENVTPASEGGDGKPQAQQPDSAASAAASDPGKAPTAAGSSDSPKTEGNGDATRTTDGAVKTDGAAATVGQTNDGGTKADSTPAAEEHTGGVSGKKDSKKESSSKKKKGLKKIVPW